MASGCSLFQTNHEWACQKKGGGAPQRFPSRAGRNHPKDLEMELSHNVGPPSCKLVYKPHQL